MSARPLSAACGLASFAFLVSSLACSSASSGGGAAGAGGDGTTGGAGGSGTAGPAGPGAGPAGPGGPGAGPAGPGGATGGGQTELSDGSIGASCGTCQAGLICAAASAAVPGGYCTRMCTADQDCAPAGHCIAAGGAQVCLRSCANDAACRPQYSCAQSTLGGVCNPTAASGGGTGAGGGGAGGGTQAGCLSPDALVGSWTAGCSSVSCESYSFAADGTVEDTWWSGASGNIVTSGTWTLACPVLTVKLSGESTAHLYDVYPAYFTDQGTMTKWKKCSGTCF